MPRLQRVSVCRVCKTELIAGKNWPPGNRRDGRLICSSCNTAAVRRWREKNRERDRARSREWAQRNRPRLRVLKRAEKLRRVYGITVDEWERVFSAQGHCCGNPGCKVKEPGGNYWMTDHDHTTGRVRGILCWSCNVVLGLMHDNVDRLRGAAHYVTMHQRHGHVA